MKTNNKETHSTTSFTTTTYIINAQVFRKMFDDSKNACSRDDIFGGLNPTIKKNLGRVPQYGAAVIEWGAGAGMSCASREQLVVFLIKGA